MKLSARLAILLTVIVAALGFAACSNDSTPAVGGMPNNVCYDFVTLVSTGDNGTVFEFRKNGDSQLITLTAYVKIDTERIKVGSRLIICYVPSGGQLPYQSGAITLYGIAQVVNGTPQPATSEEIMSLQGDPLTVKTIARSGNFIDIWAEAYGAEDGVSLSLYLDEATADSEYPATYLIYGKGDGETRLRQVYASFDVNGLLSLPGCKGVKVTYYGSAGSGTVCFDKESVLPLRPDGNETE